MSGGSLSWGMFFFFKQKTAYEMRISDWSSDVCSSDLLIREQSERLAGNRLLYWYQKTLEDETENVLAWILEPEERTAGAALEGARQIGRASCRERVCQYV